MLALVACGEMAPTKEGQDEGLSARDSNRYVYTDPMGYLAAEQEAAVWSLGNFKASADSRDYYSRLMYLLAELERQNVAAEQSNGHSSVSSQPRTYVPVEAPMDERHSDWLNGYRTFGGPPEWEDDFWERVIRCESTWQIEPGNPSYIGPMQWDPGSWATASGYTGLTDRYSWYAHGAATAVWVTHFGVDPSGTGGWYHTWRYGC